MVRVRRLAGNGVEFRAFHLQRGNRVPQSARIGMFCVVKQIIGRRAFHHPAGIHHHDAIAKAGDNAKVVADQNDRHAQLVLHFPDQFQNLRLDGHIQRGGRFVGDEKVRFGDEGHGDHDPLAHAAGELVRIHFQPMFGLGNAGFIEHGQGAIRGGGAGDFFVDHQRLDQLLPDAQERIERGHRVLEDHGNAPAADAIELPVRASQQIHTVKKSAPAFDAARRLRHQPHDGITSDGFAGAGFADDAQSLAALQLEGDILHRAHHAVAGVKRGA